MKFELGLFEAPYVDAPAAHPPLEARPRPGPPGGAGLDRAAGQRRDRSRCATTSRSIAVIGPNADSARNLLGDYAHIAHIETLLEMRDNPIGFPVPDDLSLSDTLEGRSTILDAIRERCARRGRGPLRRRRRHPRGERRRDPGGGRRRPRGADVAIVVVGERSGLTLECTCGEMRDRMELGAARAPGGAGGRGGGDRHAGGPGPRRRTAARDGGRRRALGRRARTRGCPATRDPRRSPRSCSATPTRAASSRSRCRATSARSRSTTRTSPRAGARTGTATTSTARTCRCGPSATGSPTRASRCTAPSSTARRSRSATRSRSPSRWRTSASARATRSSSSTCATRRRA